MTAVVVLGVVAGAIVGGILRHVLVATIARGLDIANLLGCLVAGAAVGLGIDGSASTLVLTAGCGSLTSLSGILTDTRYARRGAALRIVAGVLVVVTTAAVARRIG